MYRLLIADDEPIERSTLAMIISRAFDNIEVVGEASNGREAIARAKELKPGIVIMDVKMPGISGVEAARTIKSFDCNIKIIIVTAYDYFDNVLESLKTGIDDFLLKPVLKEDLVKTLKKVIQKIETEQKQRQLEENVNLKLKELSTFLKRELIATILLNPEAQQIQSYLHLLDIKFDQACGVLISLSDSEDPILDSDSARRKIYDRRIYEKAIKILEELQQSFIPAVLENGLYVLLIMDGIEGGYNCKVTSLNVIGKVKKTIYTNFGIKLRAGIGNTVSSVENLYDSFFEAKIARDHNPDIEYGSHFNDIDMKIHYIQYPFNEEKKLCDTVTNGHFEEAESLAERLVKWVVTNCHSIKETREKLFEIIVMITRAASTFEHIDSRLLDTSVYWEGVRKLQSVTEIDAYMRRTVREITDGINRVRDINMNKQISQALDFIKANYQKNIRLDDVARSVSLSPYYLSKLFKTVTGQNFIDYLTQYRLSVAEAFLKEGGCNVSEICFRVGYNDPNYFSKLFKKFYHRNPSDYKCT